MKKVWKLIVLPIMLVCLLWLQSSLVEASEKGQIKDGVFAGLSEEDKALELSGMTADQAREAIEGYVTKLREIPITLVAGGGRQVTVSAGELGLAWDNPQIVDQALHLGTQGNVVQRYKMLKDLEHDNQVLVMEFSVSDEAVRTVLTEQCAVYDQEAVDMALVRENKVFSVVEGQPGYALNVEESLSQVMAFLENDWDFQSVRLELEVDVTEPRGTREELLQVQDILGTFSTSFKTSNANRQGNINVASEKINGILLYPGDEFSSIQVAGPFSQANGYFKAGAFLNGKVVESYGGGICQVTTTLYAAVLRAELDVTMRYNHSMIVSYVEPSEDAAIASSAGKDFKFVNNTDYPVYIEGYTTKDRELVFNIYGVETRPATRTVEYVPEILEEIPPSADVITVDAGKPIGYIEVDSAHTGYKSRLWKVVKENGAEVSREKMNSSSYKMTPKSAVVGVATADPNAYNEIMAAIGTGSIAHVKNVIAVLTQTPMVEAPVTEPEPQQ